MVYSVRISQTGIVESVEADDARGAARVVANRYPEISDTRVSVNTVREFTAFYLTPKRRLTVKATYDV